MRELEVLSPIQYRDTTQKISLECFADTLVYRKEKGSNTRTLVAARFGGYPEQIRGMSDVIGGGINLEAEIENHKVIITTLKKQYRKTLAHDGVYAEATLFANDDVNEEFTEDDDGSQKQMENKLTRNMFIFCQEGDTNSLYAEIDKKISVPLIPEFKDYVLSEFTKHNILIPLEVLSASERFDAYMLTVRQDEMDVIRIINRGLQTKQIAIPDAATRTSDFRDINTVSQYLKTYGVTVANRIRDSFVPLFDPSAESICDKLKRINGYLHKNVGYSLYPAQLAVAEAVKRRLDKAKVALIIAECGSGKTKIGACALAAHQTKKSLNAVLCPSHVTKKWVREITETLPNTKAVVIHSISDVNAVYDDYIKGNKTVYLIMSKEKARDGYMKQPAVRYSTLRRGYVCPDCGKVIEMELNDDGSKYKVRANQFYFMRETDKNHRCEHCGTSLWTALNPNKQGEWVKIGNYGFVHRRFAAAHLEKCKNAKVYEKIEEIVRKPDGFYQAAGAYRRYTISGYIKSKIGQIDGFIADELHQFKGDSGQGNAMAQLVGCSNKVIGMTATLINGYSSGIFYLLYRIAPYLMLADNKTYNNPGVFNTEYGVTETVYEMEESSYNANCRNRSRKLREKQLPGVSPLIYSRFLLESAVFLSLNDMGKNLPEYEEIPIKLELDSEVKKEYDRIENCLTGLIRSDKKAARKILSRYLGLLTTYPDQPYAAEPINYPGTDRPIVEPKDTSNFDTLNEKDEAVLDIVERKVKNGERILLYTNWVKTDTQDKLKKLLTEHGYRVEILQAKIAPDKREQWVDDKVKKGLDVLITNPSLVETGLDLNAFTTLIYYNIGYNLFTFRQSSRRSWRINQTAPRVEVYILYFADVMQARAIRLMASKLAVATIIEGNLSDEGLAAMSDCRDMTTLLAKELTLGIKNEVEDVAETFKKMAILHDDDDAEEISDEDYMILPEAEVAATPEVEERNISAKLTVIPATPVPNEQSQKLTVSEKIDYSVAFIASKRKRKIEKDDPNQLSLFDLIAS